ncbi:hypothetical protein GRI35_02465 [Altererythrobacter aestiaquae]|uniref:Dolichyl-phosphate-mannose-protein mannosyltransferase n=2 Tax=Pontixanthobacter aestiaquae TaxID=1509367 RepID=A0A844Z567_9SPHN|nr:hypothetical protein [Pontixanthobacter aestiaquae]
MVGFKSLSQNQFPDPDDVLRLVQVRDLLAGQSWFDLHQYRIDPPNGTLMHWSRIVDIPIALVIVALTPLLGVSAAETAALVIVPLLTLGAILFVVGRLAWRKFDVQVAGLACLCIGLLAPVVFQLQPMRLDHHGWQIFTVALALWSISIRAPWKGGAAAGLAMALGLSISIEILPMVAAFGGVLALRWFRDRSERWWLTAYMQALALGLAVLFLVARGVSDLAQHCDAVSPAHLGFFVITALGTGAIAAAPRVPLLSLAGLFALAGAAGLTFFGLSSPNCLATPFTTLDPVVRDFWYVNILEGRPLWEQDLLPAIPGFAQLVIALAASVTLALRNRDWLRIWWTEYTLLLLAGTVLALLVWRSTALAGVIAAIPLAWLATRLLRRLRLAEGAGAKALSAAAIVLILLPATPVTLYKLLAPSVMPAAEGNAQADKVGESRCVLRDQTAKLGALPRGVIFAPLDIGPSILLNSNHAVVATGHHRAEAGMRDVILAFSGDPANAQAIAAKHGADYLVMCTDIVEPSVYAEANPDGLAAQLIAGNPPDWLSPVTFGGPEEFQVWQVEK